MPFGPTKPDLRAIRYRQGKATLPTTLSARDLARLDADIRERSMFSARTTDARYLQTINDIITRLVSPETVDGRPARPGEYMNPATARLALKQALAESGYVPGTTGPIGSLKDLASDKRLNLIIRMNSEFSWGYGKYAASRDPDALDAWPAQELYRLEDRAKRRPWAERWVRAGGRLFDGGDDPDLGNRRLIALKADPIWTAISAFGLPYPPYDYNSGMWIRDISRGEAEDLGLLSPGATAPEPPARGFNDDLQASITDIADSLQTALKAILPQDFTIENGILKKRPKAKNSQLAANYQGQPRDSLGRWVDENGGGLDDRHNIARGLRAARRAQKGGDVLKAMWIKDLGQVDFYQGTPGEKKVDQRGTTHRGGWGVAHIQSKRGREGLKSLPYTIALGKVSRHESDSSKRYVSHEDRVAVLKKTGEKRWRVESHIFPIEKEKGLWATRLKGHRRQVKR